MADDPLSHAIREHIIAYLEGGETLLDLHSWLVGATWDIEDRDEPKAVDLTYEIKLALAEHGRGDISAADLRERLRDLVDVSEAAAATGVAEPRVRP
jgi:hypothetical protein